MRWGPTRRRSRRLKALCRRPATTACACFWSDRSQQIAGRTGAFPGARRLRVEVVHASEVITMEDKVDAIRAKRDSSIRVGLRLVREGRASGFVTAGNTGAAMATAKVVLGALPGVDRPALAAAFPTASEYGCNSAERRRERRLHCPITWRSSQ